MTKQRLLIYDIIKNSEEHLTAEEIFFVAKKDNPTIAFGTIYRNLGLMLESGEIGKVGRANEPTRYDKSNLPHCHKKCKICGRIEDIAIAGLDKLLKKQVHSLDSYELNINYICDKCKIKG